MNPLFEPLGHMRPYIRISPFSPSALASFSDRPADSQCAVQVPAIWLDQARWMGFYASGRQAISACLHLERLGREDEVLIVTTTQGPYISSCVTDSVEQVCSWSRELTSRTKLALVIHEFGFPCDCDVIAECKARGIPVVEDCAYALGSRTAGAAVGRFGDYAIYSLPKHLPLPYGGILASTRHGDPPRRAGGLEEEQQTLLLSLANHMIQIAGKENLVRRANWRWFAQKLRAFGMEPYFSLPSTVVPGVFVARLDEHIDGAKLKQDLLDAGIEATQYYGMGGFYFPVHQHLVDYERKYIAYHIAKSLQEEDMPPEVSV